jgi:hypothetical protein
MESKVKKAFFINKCQEHKEETQKEPHDRSSKSFPLFAAGCIKTNLRL